MDLLERYLQAIGQYLPAETRDDTLAELRVDLLEQMDANAEERGRPLDDHETAEILRGYGKPEVVALKYLPQRSLIGPAVFPFYMLTLTRVLPLVIFASLLAKGIEFVSSHQESPAHALGSFAVGLWSSLLLTAAIITVIFACIEWALQRGKLGTQWNEWDATRLPAVKPNATSNSPKSVVKRAIELSVHCLWMAYVLWAPWHPFWLIGPGVFYLGSLNVTLAPAWHTFYVLLVVLLTVQLVIRILAFFPHAQRMEQPLDLAARLPVIAAFGYLATQSVLFVASGAGANLQQVADVNEQLTLAFRIVLVLIVVGFIADVWKYAKRRMPLPQMAL